MKNFLLYSFLLPSLHCTPCPLPRRSFLTNRNFITCVIVCAMQCSSKEEFSSGLTCRVEWNENELYNDRCYSCNVKRWGTGGRYAQHSRMFFSEREGKSTEENEEWTIFYIFALVSADCCCWLRLSLYIPSFFDTISLILTWVAQRRERKARSIKIA